MKATIKWMAMLCAVVFMLGAVGCASPAESSSTPDTPDAGTTTAAGDSAGTTTAGDGTTQAAPTDDGTQAAGSTTAAGTGAVTTKKTDSANKTTAAGGPAAAADRPYKNKKIDLGGRDFTILMLNGGTDVFPDPDSDTYEDDLARIAYVEKTYNCKLKFDRKYAFPEIHDYIVTNALSGLYVADLMYSLPWQTVEPYITQKIAVPLDQYLNFDHKMLKDMTLNSWGNLLNDHYIFVTSQNGVNCGMLYNKDIFQRDNLEDPFELQQKGQWTWEKFLEIAEKATKRDASGKVTQWGVVTSSGADFMMQLFASNGAEPLTYKNDQFKVNFKDKKVTQVFEFLNQIVVQKKCGILTELVLEAPERGDRMWKQGKAAMAFTSFSVAKQYSPANCGFIVCPKGPSASDYATPAHCGAAYMVPTSAKNPEASAYILYDFFARWDNTIPGGMDAYELEEFKTGAGQYEMAFCDNDFETFKLYIEKQTTGVMNVVRFNELQNFLINCIYAPNVYKNVPLSTAIEQWSAVAEDTIAEVNDKLAKMKK